VNRSLTPPDAQHRFGHGKAEALAALGQGALVIGSGLFLIAEALGRLMDPAEISAGTAGIGIMVLSMVLTGGLVLYQRHVVRRTNSLTIAADSLHYRTDFLINAAVIVSLALSTLAGWELADPVLALAIAAYILFSAWEIGSSAVSQLMDRELPDEQRQRIRQIVLDHPDVLDLHDMRTRTSGQQIFIELHIELDGRMSLYRSHVIAETVMADIGVEFPGTQVLVHQDPAGVEEPMTDYSRT
jgi:ferrous-iron efflux pump FieF